MTERTILHVIVSEYNEFGYGEVEPEPQDEFMVSAEMDSEFVLADPEDDPDYEEASEAAIADMLAETSDDASSTKLSSTSASTNSSAGHTTASKIKISPNEGMRGWTPEAACRGAEVRRFFYSEDALMQRKARAICSVCPVLKHCLVHAVREREKEGVWGGTDPDTRKRLVRKVFRAGSALNITDLEAMPRKDLLNFLEIDGLYEELQAEILSTAKQEYSHPTDDEASLKNREVADPAPPQEAEVSQPVTQTTLEIQEAIEHLEPPEVEITTLALLPSVVEIDETPEFDQPIKLWDDQAECLLRVQQAIDRGQERIFFQMAPSRGKTTVVAELAKRELEYTPNLRIGFFSHTKEIQEQARDRFEQIIGPEYTYKTFGYRTTKDALADAQVIFSTLQKLHHNTNLPTDFFDIIIVDESHHSHAQTFRDVIEYFRPAHYVAMSATPKRADALDTREIFGPAVYQQSITDAMNQPGLLTPVRYKLILPEGVDKPVGGFRFSNKRIAELLERAIADDGIPDPLTMVFASRIKQADSLAGYIPNSIAWHAHNRSGITEFRKQQKRTMTTVSLGAEGLDIPAVNVLGFASSTRSEGKFVQQIGRVLRRAPGKEYALALDFAANIDQIRLLQTILPRSEPLEILRVKSEPRNHAVGGPLSRESSDENTDPTPTMDQVSPTGNEEAEAPETSGSDLLTQQNTPPDVEAKPDMAHREDSAQHGRPTPRKPLFNFDYPARPERDRSLRLHSDILDAKTTTVALEDVLQEMDNKFVLPEGSMSIRRFSSSYKVSRDLVYHILEALDITELPVFRDESTGRILAIPLSREIQAKILTHPQFTERIPSAPEGVPSVNVLARKLNVDPKTLRRRMGELGHPESTLDEYMYGAQTAAGVPTWLAEKLEADTYIQKLQPPPEDSGIISLSQYAKNRNIETFTTVQKRFVEMLAQEGLTLANIRRYKFGAKTGTGLTPDQQAQLTSFLNTYKSLSSLSD